MQVCGFVGSPKKNGNVDFLVSQVLKGASSKRAKTSKTYLNELHVKPCQSCGVDPYPKHCLFDDDMKKVYAALELCDVIVLGSPVYFDTVSAQTKLMIDRCNCLLPHVRRSNGTWEFERRIKKQKKGVFVVVAGAEQESNTILATVKGFFNWANIELVETVTYQSNSNELGNVRNNNEAMNKAFQIGLKIAER